MRTARAQRTHAHPKNIYGDGWGLSQIIDSACTSPLFFLVRVCVEQTGKLDDKLYYLVFPRYKPQFGKCVHYVLTQSIFFLPFLSASCCIFVCFYVVWNMFCVRISNHSDLCRNAVGLP